MNRDKIFGALFGVAVGDALGAPVEFMSANEIISQYGRVTTMLGGGWLNLNPGEITDDTEMSLCVAEGIVIAPQTPVGEIGSRFIDWYNTRPKDIVRACEYPIRNVLRNSRKSGKIANTKAWFDAAIEAHGSVVGLSAGNGALMRTVYTGLYYGTEHAPMTADIAKMTHWNDESTEACLIYSQIIALLTAGADVKIIADVLRGTRYADHRQTYSPSVNVVDSMCCALDSLLATNNFENAVVAAVNLGGDADTIGAITGGLAGARYGLSAIPKIWLDKLSREVTDQINRLAEIAYNKRTEQK